MCGRVGGRGEGGSEQIIGHYKPLCQSLCQPICHTHHAGFSSMVDNMAGTSLSWPTGRSGAGVGCLEIIRFSERRTVLAPPAAAAAAPAAAAPACKGQLPVCKGYPGQSNFSPPNQPAPAWRTASGSLRAALPAAASRCGTGRACSYSMEGGGGGISDLQN